MRPIEPTCDGVRVCVNNMEGTYENLSWPRHFPRTSWMMGRIVHIPVEVADSMVVSHLESTALTRSRGQ